MSQLTNDQDFITELEYLITIAKHPKTITLLKCKVEEARSVLTGVTKDAGEQLNSVDHEAMDTVQALSPPAKTSVSSTPSATKIKEYGWDQSDKFIKLYISSIPGLNQVTQKDIINQFSERELEINVKIGMKTFSLVIKDLYDVIISDKSYVKAKSEMITVMLRKGSSGHWDYLTATEKKLKDSKQEKPPKMGEDEDPGTGLMKIMKKMYDDGDDEMKRTISKAWCESQEKRANGSEGLL